MSTSITQEPLKCFCSSVAKRTIDDIWVCGQYKSGGMVCLFHLHDVNMKSYYQPNLFPLTVDCQMCLATIKIHSKQYIAPCRVPSVRCDCGLVATFYQSKKENANCHSYFFGCPRWKTDEKCHFFAWAHPHKTIRDLQIFCRLLPSSPPVSKSNSLQSTKHSAEENNHLVNMTDGELRRQLECVVCLGGERNHLISPCNHLCCCSTCAIRIGSQCPLCRKPVGSIQRIYFS